MSFTTFSYMAFLPVVLLLYYLLPKPVKNPLLLAASYFFYACWNPVYSLLMLLSTAITYFCAVLTERKAAGKRKLWLALSLCLNLGILFVFKYFNFFSDTIASVIHSLGGTPASARLELLLPVGISFYTFQALGYTIDVYRGDLPAERNFIDYALFISFFPQLVAGPIERSGHLLPQLKVARTFSTGHIVEGMLPICWGFFKKLVIADNLAVLVNTAYAAPAEHSALQLVIATVAFAFQIYCDFSAYSDIARGSAAMLGVRLMENFDRPYLASSIQDFWRRWHISLSGWFRDYVYFPLGGSRVSTPRRALNILVVFLLSGLWHGAAMTYVLWGLLHGLYQVVGVALQGIKRRARNRLHIAESNRALAGLRIACTFALVTFAWILFRANSVQDAGVVISRIFSLAPGAGSLKEQILALGLTQKNCIMVAAAVFCLALSDLFCHGRAAETRINRSLLTRYAALFALIAATLLFGAYGENVDPQQFVYFQF